MPTNTILLILLSVLVAGGLSYIQYFYKNKNSATHTKIVAALRFVSIFGLLLLLINPIISKNTFEDTKTPLAVVLDNSASIKDLKANIDAQKVFEQLISNKDLQEKYTIQPYLFDKEVVAYTDNDTLQFNGKQSNIGKVAKTLGSINKNTLYPTVLITDGNQTEGEDYTFAFPTTHKVYPVVVGDTTQYLDLKITQVNANKYAFLKNKFPVEVFLQYNGTKPITANFSIVANGTTVNKSSVSFSSTKKSEVVQVLLPAEKIGLQVYTAKIESNTTEKNLYNNTKRFAVEVIDQRTEIAIISSINHPDIGALKRSIETNAQRKVTLGSPNQITDLSKFNVLVLYQPNADFKKIYEANKTLKINTFTITGLATDFNFLNQQQNTINFKMSSQKEDYLAVFDSNFNLFAPENIGFETFPPLENPFGAFVLQDNVSVLLKSKIRNVETEDPLLCFTENLGKRNAFLLGENSWKWRAKSFVNKNSFEIYDQFIDKTIQFLASNDAKKNLIVSHERFYNSGEPVEITAQFFNKNYEFDEKARLSIVVTNKKAKQSKTYDLLKSTNSYKVNLDGLLAGTYSFTVKELNSNTSYTSGFEILDFDIEKQFVNADLAKLKQLAAQTSGKTFTKNQVEALIKQLLNANEYQTIQKAIHKKTPLIEWYWLLIIIALSLATEWFLRKWNGLL
ncbi:hypothetical protein [Flavobacterium croceum]|uniref:hypothetical protein n=1 Tax=Flavobacterium croceum TaxID=370975 RepID=UPI0024A82F4D|nr:hypothetical protein [Flavobacterium croceum]